MPSVAEDVMGPVLRIERGHAEPEELAALAAVLMARSARRTVVSDARPAGGTARWRRLERQAGFHAPNSWQAAA